MGAVTDLSERIETTKAAIQEEHDRHEERLGGLRADLGLVEDERAHALAGTEPEVRLLATHVVAVKWHKNERHDEFDAGVVKAAVADLAAGAEIMRKRYIGVKNYEGFIHQREDHDYGYGPRHGSIVFSVGLTDPIRKRLADGGELTGDEKDAAIAYLLNLEKAGVV